MLADIQSNRILAQVIWGLIFNFTCKNLTCLNDTIYIYIIKIAIPYQPGGLKDFNLLKTENRLDLSKETECSHFYLEKH